MREKTVGFVSHARATGATVTLIAALAELSELTGRQKLSDYPVHTLTTL